MRYQVSGIGYQMAQTSRLLHSFAIDIHFIFLQIPDTLIPDTLIPDTRSPSSLSAKSRYMVPVITVF